MNRSSTILVCNRLAHAQALASARHTPVTIDDQEPGYHVVNLGSGEGSSLAEFLAATRKLFGGKPDSKVHQRREGDPEVLVTSSRLARERLGWEPRRSLSECIESAAAWHRANDGQNAS